MTKITVFMGKIGSGKSYRMKELTNFGAIKVSFADELRSRAYQIIGYVPKNYDDFKKKLIYLDELPIWVSNICRKLFPKWLDGRKILQFTGDAFKVADKYYWTNLALKRMSELSKQGKNIIIDDARFKHELVAIQQFCAKEKIELEIVFCDYRSKNYEMYSNHNSEKLAEFIRDKLQFEDGHKITVDNCFYYNLNGQHYKTAVPIYSNQFLEDKDKLDINDLNDFERIVTEYMGE